MRRIGQFFLSIAGLLLLFSPYIALTFALSLIVSGIGTWAFHSSLLGSYWRVGWKVYVAIAIFNVPVMLTFTYQQCCVGLKTFFSHLRHNFSANFDYGVVGATLWPLAWYGLDRQLGSLGLPWGQILLNVFDHWFVVSRRGVEMVVVNFKTGTVTTSYTKSPNDTATVIRRNIGEMM